LFLLVVLSAACSFDTSTTIDSPSSATADAAVPTVTVSQDGGASADAGRFDRPNQNGDGGLNKAVTCEEMYGTAPSFDLCEETTNSCRFYVQTSEDTCKNLCSSYGGECVDNYDGNCASSIGSQGCNVVHYDQVCICSLP
jgi:hypothetical protein